MIRRLSPGALVTLIVGLAPAALWFAFTTDKTDAAARLSALVGLSLLAWNIILSARLKIFD